MIAWLAISVAFAEPSTSARARYQYLVAVWERAHGHDAAAAVAAQTALLHAPSAAAPRVLLAEMQEGEPGTLLERLRLLEAAVSDPAANARAYAALGRARAANGDLEGAVAAFREAALRGGSP